MKQKKPKDKKIKIGDWVKYNNESHKVIDIITKMYNKIFILDDGREVPLEEVGKTLFKSW